MGPRIANKYGVSHSNLYFWRDKLFAEGYASEIKKSEEPLTEKTIEALWAENAALAEKMEVLKRENQELENERHRLQLEADVLKKVDEILKKRMAPIPIT